MFLDLKNRMEGGETIHEVDMRPEAVVAASSRGTRREEAPCIPCCQVVFRMPTPLDGDIRSRDKKPSCWLPSQAGADEYGRPEERRGKRVLFGSE